MKCKKCPFHLMCHMGRFTAINLCPTCGKLIYISQKIDDQNIYAFFCEKRLLTKEISRIWALEKITMDSDPLNPYRPHLRIVDPGSMHILSVRECYKCTGILRMLPALKWNDLDEIATAKEEQRSHALGLRSDKPHRKF